MNFKHNGIMCVVKARSDWRGGKMHLGYVEVPEESPYHGVDYQDKSIRDIYQSVGLTYSGDEILDGVWMLGLDDDGRGTEEEMVSRVRELADHIAMSLKINEGRKVMLERKNRRQYLEDLKIKVSVQKRAGIIDADTARKILSEAFRPVKGQERVEFDDIEHELDNPLDYNDSVDDIRAARNNHDADGNIYADNYDDDPYNAYLLSKGKDLHEVSGSGGDLHSLISGLCSESIESGDFEELEALQSILGGSDNIINLAMAIQSSKSDDERNALEHQLQKKLARLKLSTFGR